MHLAASSALPNAAFALPNAAADCIASMQTDLLGAWLANRSASTVATYKAALNQLARFLGAADAASAVEALIAAGETGTNALLVAWRSSREAEGCAPATVSLGLSAARSVLRLAKRVGRITWTCDVDAPRVEAVEDRSGPAVDAVREMLRAARSHANPRVAARNAALVALLAGCGLRRAEVLALDLEHVEAGAVAILATCKGKRGRDRIELPAAVREALAAWIAQHPVGRGALFVGLHSNAAQQGYPRLRVEALAETIATLGELAGIEKRVRPHGLRHSFTSAALDAGADVRSVAAALRHADLRQVTRYDDRRANAGARAARIASAELLG
jgi:integrase